MNTTRAPRGAFGAELDLVAYASLTLFSGPSAVALPAGLTYVDDVVAFLTGRGSDTDRSLGDDAAANGTGAGVWSAGIDEDDRFYVQNDAETFDVVAGADNAAFGFDVGGQTAALVSGTTYRATATGEWTRGNITARLRLDPASGAAFDCPAYAYKAHTPVILARARGNGDADDTNAANCLEALDNDANDDPGAGGDNRIRWGLTADGKIWRARPTGVAAAITWASSDAAKALRRFLGFTGLEAEVASGGLQILTATYPAGATLCPSRPFESVIDTTRWDGSATELTGGAAVYTTVAQVRGYDVSGYIDGPADRIDLARHWIDWVVPYMRPGQIVNVYQDWGDGRRVRRARAIDASSPAYDDLYTSQRDGEYGRLRCRLAADSPAEAAVRWPGRLRRRVPFTLRFTERES